MKFLKTFTMFSAASMLACLGAAPAEAVVPNPVLFMIGTEYYTANGQSFIRYRYNVLNAQGYPADLFAAAPQLPPCGNNHNAARSWVDIFDQQGHRLYGFCSLGNPNDLNQIWFALPEGQVPPSYVYIEVNDRQTNTKYRSNLADTVM